MQLDLSAALLTIESMITGAIALLPKLLVAGLFFTAAWWVSGALGRVVASLLARAGQPQSVGLVLSRLARWAMLVVGGLVSLTIVVPSLNAGTVVGALGVGGVAIGFAFKDIFQNLLAGLLLLMTRPFQIGDYVVAGSHEGRVEDIQVRATLLRAPDGRQVVVPNSDLYTNRVIVNTPQTSRRGVVNVGIGYDDDIEQAKRVITAAVKALPQVLDEPAPSVITTGLGDSSVQLAVRFWVAPAAQGGDLLGATDAVVIATKQALGRAGIEIPFPIQTLLLPRSEQGESGPAPANEPFGEAASSRRA